MKLFFESAFLVSLVEELGRKSKTLKHSSNLILEKDNIEGKELLTVKYQLSNYCIYEFFDDQCSNICIRSSARKDRGKYLLLLSEIYLLDRPMNIVESIAETSWLARNLSKPDQQLEAKSAIEALWKDIAFSAV